MPSKCRAALTLSSAPAPCTFRNAAFSPAPKSALTDVGLRSLGVVDGWYFSAYWINVFSWNSAASVLSPPWWKDILKSYQERVSSRALENKCALRVLEAGAILVDSSSLVECSSGTELGRSPSVH